MSAPAFPPRSGYDMVGGIVFFGRMLDKIRLQQAGKLPSDYNLGRGFDGRLCRFLRIDYDALCQRVFEGGSDEEILDWCFQRGGVPGEEDVVRFNAFLSKRGWRDDVSEWVAAQKQAMGLSARDDIQTAFDVHDADEGRK